MKNDWFVTGIAVTSLVAAFGVARVFGDGFSHHPFNASRNHTSARQQMAQMVARTAARSAAQTTRALVLAKESTDDGIGRSTTASDDLGAQP